MFPDALGNAGIVSDPLVTRDRVCVVRVQGDADGLALRSTTLDVESKRFAFVQCVFPVRAHHKEGSPSYLTSDLLRWRVVCVHIES